MTLHLYKAITWPTSDEHLVPGDASVVRSDKDHWLQS